MWGKTVVGLLTGLAALGLAASARAQDYPARSITVIVPAFTCGTALTI